MMKLRASGAGGDVLILALSHANLDRLREQGLGGMILVSGAEVGIRGEAGQTLDVIITAAKDEAAMLEAFKDGIGPGTILHVSEKLKSS